MSQLWPLFFSIGIIIMSHEHTESFYFLWWVECQFGREAAILETSLAIALPSLVVYWRLQWQVIPSNSYFNQVYNS